MTKKVRETTRPYISEQCHFVNVGVSQPLRTNAHVERRRWRTDIRLSHCRGARCNSLILTLCSVSSSSSSGLKASAQTWKTKREEITKKKQSHENIKQIKFKFLSSVFYFPTGKTKSLLFLCCYSVRSLNPIYSLSRHSMAVLELWSTKSVTSNRK